MPPETLHALGDRGPVQAFARAACWTDPPAMVPDLVGMLHQSLVAPWGELLRRDPEASGLQRLPASEEPDERWAERIASAAKEPDPGDGQAPVEAPEALAAFASVATADRGDRFWAVSPVKSGRFD